MLTHLEERETASVELPAGGGFDESASTSGLVRAQSVEQTAVCSRGADAEKIALDPENVEKGLAQLVLTLVELVRQLLERQAVRRIDEGSLTDEQVERMGETFIKLEAKVRELKEIFALSDEELNINLGPLGDLM